MISIKSSEHHFIAAHCNFTIRTLDLESAIGTTNPGVAEPTAATNQDSPAAAESADYCTAVSQRRKAK